MAIPRNGCKTSKSWSPLIRHVALPQTANSRNLLSFGSRHALMVSSSSSTVAASTNAAKNLNRSKGKIYLSNFGRCKTLLSSSMVAAESSSFASRNALSNAFRAVERFSNAALINTFVSQTTARSVIVQQFCERFRR